MNINRRTFLAALAATAVAPTTQPLIALDTEGGFLAWQELPNGEILTQEFSEDSLLTPMLHRGIHPKFSLTYPRRTRVGR